MTMPLEAYMKRERMSDAELAALIGKDRSIANRIRRGEMKPSLETAALIERETGGAVPMQAWITDPDTLLTTCEPASEQDAAA